MTEPNTSIMFDTGDFADFYDGINYTSNDSVFEPNEDTQPCNIASPISFPVSVVICNLYVLIFLLAIPGNTLVCLVIGFSKQALTPSNLYLLHLAVADILLAVTLPFWATSIIQGWVFGDSMCKIMSLLQEVSFYASILFLACISVDRYLVIVRGMEARKANRRLVSCGACGAVWFIGGILSLPGLYNHASLHGKRIVCMENYDHRTADNWRLATRGLHHTLGFLIPLVIMLVCYSITVVRLLQTRRGFQKQRAMRVIVAVVVAFLLCWTPYHLAVIADTLLRMKKAVKDSCPARILVDRVLIATQSLGVLHSCVNPVLYAFVGEKFRKRLLQVLRKSGMLERASLSRSSQPSVTRRSSLISEANSTFM